MRGEGRGEGRGGKAPSSKRSISAVIIICIICTLRDGAAIYCSKFSPPPKKITFHHPTKLKFNPLFHSSLDISMHTFLSKLETRFLKPTYPDKFTYKHLKI